MTLPHAAGARMLCARHRVNRGGVGMATETKQEVVGDKAHEHHHPAQVHTHDHWHVTHVHTGGPLGEFAHRSHYHLHEHDHAALVHAHKDREEANERNDHESVAHIHDHKAPAGTGASR